MAISKNKIFLKGKKVSGYWRHTKECDDTESYTTPEVLKVFLTVAASLG
jgi:hypothetical protein